MWQCRCCAAPVFITQTPASVTAAGECYSPAVTCSHCIATHLTHNTSVYLTWDFVHWGCGGFLVHGLFNTKTLVSCPSHVTVKINNDCQNLDGKSMTLVTLPRCGLMLMWLLLTAGTFDTICPWTIQHEHEQWFSSRRVNFPSTGLQYCLSPSVWGWRNGGWCQYLTICHYLYLGEIWYSEKRELMSPNMTTGRHRSPRGLIWLLLYHFPHQQITHGHYMNILPSLPPQW